MDYVFNMLILFVQYTLMFCALKSKCFKIKAVLCDVFNQRCVKCVEGLFLREIVCV